MAFAHCSLGSIPWPVASRQPITARFPARPRTRTTSNTNTRDRDDRSGARLLGQSLRCRQDGDVTVTSRRVVWLSATNAYRSCGDRRSRCQYSGIAAFAHFPYEKAPSTNIGDINLFRELVAISCSRKSRFKRHRVVLPHRSVTYVRETHTQTCHLNSEQAVRWSRHANPVRW